jgi:hypothetical protein
VVPSPALSSSICERRRTPTAWPRFAAALGLDKGGNAEIIGRLIALCNEKKSGGGGLLLLVDSAEDALQGEAGAAGQLHALLGAALGASQQVKLLITSRVAVGVKGVAEQVLKPLSPEAAACIAVAAAPGLPVAETQAVVSAAGGSSLLLWLMADSLKTGRITTQVRPHSVLLRSRLARAAPPHAADR